MAKRRGFQLAGYVVGVVLVGLLLANFLACEPPVGPDGGAGADFDATLYYTKTEVDALVADVVRDTGETGQLLAGVDWDGRTPVGFTPPSDATGALVEIVATNGSATDKTYYIQFSSDDTGGSIVAQFTLIAGAGYTSFTGYAVVPAGSGTMYAWHDTIHSGAAADITSVDISVRPVVWLK